MFRHLPLDHHHPDYIDIVGTRLALSEWNDLAWCTEKFETHCPIILLVFISCFLDWVLRQLCTICTLPTYAIAEFASHLAPFAVTSLIPAVSFVLAQYPGIFFAKPTFTALTRRVFCAI